MRARRLGRWFARLAVASAFGAVALAGVAGAASAADAEPWSVVEVVALSDDHDVVEEMAGVVDEAALAPASTLPAVSTDHAQRDFEWA